LERSPRILVMGATGLVGGAVVERLKRDATVQVVAAARDVAKARILGVPVVHLDLDNIDTFAPALQEIDRIFLVTGYSVDLLRQSKDLVNCAKRAGVELIVHLGAGGNNDTRIAHYGWHQFVERYIEWSRIGFVHLRPEMFMQNLFGCVKAGVIRNFVGATRLSWVDVADIASVAARCLLDPAQHSGNTYRLGYDAESYDEIASLMSASVGQPFRYEARPPLEFLSSVLAAGAEPAYMKSVFDSYTDFTNGLDDGADDTFDNFVAITGSAPRTMVDFIRDNAGRFRY
jgi:NAD(P)H dehydrogenase (quinone)